MLIFEILQLIRENEGIPTFEYSPSELYGFFVVTGTALSVISCINFFCRQLTKFFFLSNFFFETLLPTKILCQATFAALNAI